MKIVSLVTLYYPNDLHIQNIRRFCECCDFVYLLDNTPKINNNFLDVKSLRNAKYIKFGKNYGLSKCFNECLKTMNENCFVVFFDQDSYCPDNYIEIMKKDYLKLKEKEQKLLILGPSYYERNSKKTVSNNKKNEILPGVSEVSSVITSGAFMELDLIKHIDYWNEDFFLDLADHEICWRAKTYGYKTFITSNVLLSHSLGKSFHDLKIVKIKEGASFRVYYQIRDGLRLFFMKYSPLKFKIRFLGMFFVRPLAQFLFLPNKLDRIVFFWKGVIDFIKNKKGEIE